MKFPPQVTRSLGSARFNLGNHAPAILTGAGVLGFIATTALAIRATNKAAGIVPEFQKELADVKKTEVSDIYPEQAKRREIVRTYGTFSIKMLGLYGPMLATGSSSIICVLAGHGIMRNRQASLVAAYTVMDAAFRNYRSKVQEELGEEKEKLLFRGFRQPDVVEGEEIPPCEIIDLEDRISPYARFFDELNPNWSHTGEYNLIFLRQAQAWANNRLKAHGYLFLNEVYQGLGLERSQAGQTVGWKVDKDGNGCQYPDGRGGVRNGDGFVDFGIYNIADENSRAFVNLKENSILLDFNVDGPIRI